MIQDSYLTWDIFLRFAFVFAFASLQALHPRRAAAAIGSGREAEEQESRRGAPPTFSPCISGVWPWRPLPFHLPGSPGEPWPARLFAGGAVNCYVYCSSL